MTSFIDFYFSSDKILKLEFENVTTLKQLFYKDVNDIVAFHFYLTNIILLSINENREGKFYHFCNRIKKKCMLCKMSTDFSRTKRKGKEHLERYRHNFDALKKIAHKMWPFFEECFILDKFSLDFFSKEYLFSLQNTVDCSYHYVTLQEIIDNNEYLQKLNSDKRYFEFTYCTNFFDFL